LPPSAPGVTQTPPPPSPAGPGRSSRPFLILGAATVVVLAAFALFTLLTGDDDGGAGPFSPVAEAAEKTANLPGARIDGNATVSSAAATMNLHISGAFNAEENRSTMQMDLQSNTPLPGGVAITPMTIVQDGTTMYMTAPVFSGQLPDGKSWMKLDMGEVLDEELLEQQSSTDPRAMLKQLAAEGAVTPVGTERIQGAKTTRYTVALPSALEQGPGTSNSDVWVDKRGYVRRVTMSMPFGAFAGSGTQMAMTMDFFDYGAEPDIVPPPDDQTFDATEMLSEGADEAGFSFG
jgi:hypothetical protein